jgi:hypothetical protein
MADDVLAAIDRAALRKRGTMRQWMAENKAAFAGRLVTQKPDWSALAKVFSDAGLLDARGNPPTAEATRKTWQRVRGPVRRKAIEEQQPVARQVMRSQPPTDDDDDSPPIIRRQVTRPK